MAKFSVDGDDYGEGPSNPTRAKRRKITPKEAKRRKITPEEEEDEHNVEVKSEATEDHSVTTGEYDEGQGSEEEQEEEYDALEDDGEQISEEYDRRAVEIPPVKDDRGKSISVIFTDPEVLDCCICYETLSSPIFQCENGHIACPSCCVKLGNKCPVCSMPIGYNRCRALEIVLESFKVSCSNAAYGCKELLSYSKRNEHEKECIYVPCLCPQSGCDAVACSKEISLHFGQIHVGSGISFQYDCHFSFDVQPESKVTVLQEKNDGNLFILNNIVEIIGNLVYVNGIGPNSSSSEFQYDLYAKSEGCYLELRSFMEFSEGHIAKAPSTSKFLLIPAGFFGPHEQITLGICIRRLKPQIQHMQ